MERQKRKSTKAQARIRRKKIYQLLIEGNSRGTILQFVAKMKEKADYWNVSERTIDNDIHICNEQIEEASAVNRKREFGRAAERLNQLYRLALNKKDFRLALAIERVRIDMYSLGKHSGADVVDDRLDTLLEEITKKAKENEDNEP